MAEPSSTTSPTVVSEELDPEYGKYVTNFFDNVGVSSTIPENHSTVDIYSTIVGAHLKVRQIQRGHITAHLTVKPAIAVITFPFIQIFIMCLISEKMVEFVFSLTKIFGLAELFRWNTWRGNCSCIRTNGDWLC